MRIYELNMFMSPSVRKLTPNSLTLPPGGPGCSSELAVFFENGPWHLTANQTLEESEYGWDVAANMIYVDQPVNTGFSYSTSDEDRCYDEDCVSSDMLDFLLALYEARPELMGKDVYVTGESYAGHYVPAVASRLFRAHREGETASPINLKGLAIGNGLTNPRIQYGAYADYLRVNGKIGATLYYYVNLVRVVEREKGRKKVVEAEGPISPRTGAT